MNLGSIVGYLRRLRRQNQVVQDVALLDALRRFPVFSAVAALINVFYVNMFWGVYQSSTTPIRHTHAIAVIWTNSVMGVFMLVTGWLAFRHCQARARGNGWTFVLALAVCIGAMGYGLTLAVIDQWITDTITPSVLIFLLVAFLALMRPWLATVVFALAYVIFYFALPLTREDPAMVEQVRRNVRDILLLCEVVALVSWRQYVVATLMQREIRRSHKALANKQMALANLASRDALTGLYNRREFMRLADVELVRARRNGAPIHIVMLDIDHFKQVNDVFGHPAGDAVLVQTAARLQGSARRTDVLARLGGEEFIIFLPDTGQRDAVTLAEKFRLLIKSQPYDMNGTTISITASFGVIGLRPGQTESMTNLYAAADAALYDAKRSGRDRVELAELKAPVQLVG